MKISSYLKYGNRKTEVDGITFDSAKEARRYSELKLLERAGKINNLVLQPVYQLVPNFTDDWGNKHRGITYRADFSYYDKEKKLAVVEDCKGMKTEVYKIKKKLFLLDRKGYNTLFIET